MLYFYTKNNKRYKILSRTKEHGNLYVGQARKMHIKDWFYQVGGEYKVEDLKVRFNNTYQMPLPIKITFSDAVFENDLKQNMLFYPYCERGYSEFYEGSRGDLFLENGLLESDTFTTADLIYKDEDDFFKYFISDVFNSLDLVLSASKNMANQKNYAYDINQYEYLAQEVIVKGEVIATMEYNLKPYFELDKINTFTGMSRVREFYPSATKEFSLKDYLIKYILISQDDTNESATKKIKDVKAKNIKEVEEQEEYEKQTKKKLKRTKKIEEKPKVVNEDNPLDNIKKKDFMDSSGKVNYDAYNAEKERVRKNLVKKEVEVLSNLPEGRQAYKVTYSGEGFITNGVKTGQFGNTKVQTQNSFIVYNEAPRAVGTFYIINDREDELMPSYKDNEMSDCLFYDKANDKIYKDLDYEFKYYSTIIKLIPNKRMYSTQKRSNW